MNTHQISNALPSSIFDNPTLAAEHIAAMTAKLFGNYAAMQSVHEVEVGTAPKDVVYEDGKLKLYHFRPQPGIRQSVQTPVLVVYALVNRPYMLDLQPDRSMIRNLLAQGLDVYMIDWGYPTKADRFTTLDDYVSGYIGGCVQHIQRTTGFEKISLVGICQGGTLSTIYSTLYPEHVNALIPIATPIDFSTNEGLLFHWAKSLDVDAIVDAFGVVPDTFLNAGFLMVKPFARLEKYAAALDLHDESEKLQNFLRMEQWIFDSPAQAGECLRQFVKDLYQENRLLKGTLQLGKRTATLKNLTMPLLNVYASSDHIVPPQATVPLNDYAASKDKTLLEIPGGHIGIFVGAKAQRELAPKIAEWLKQRDNWRQKAQQASLPRSAKSPTAQVRQRTRPSSAAPKTAPNNILSSPHAQHKPSKRAKAGT
jgi:polyhydroxyalkanoate synthase